MQFFMEIKMKPLNGYGHCADTQCGELFESKKKVSFETTNGITATKGNQYSLESEINAYSCIV